MIVTKYPIFFKILQILAVSLNSSKWLAKRTNCTFDFYDAVGRVGNYGITAVDSDTVVKFANNTVMGGTLFEPSKVIQGILNTPDAQGNMSVTF